VNHRLESRVREIRLHGSEGGGAVSSPYPYNKFFSDLLGDLSWTIMLWY